jgi:hypothetical protein
MTRDANLYILSKKEWKPLCDILENNKDYTLKNDVTIFQLMTSTSINLEYAILTLSEATDKIVDEYGAIQASNDDMLRNSLHNYFGNPLFGDKTNLTFLNKI